MFEFWLLFGGLSIILEVVLGFTVVLFFTGLACFTVAGLMHYNIIDNASIIDQFTVFFVATILWTTVLWKPFKTMMNRITTSNNSSISIIGQKAVVAEGKLQINKIGTVKWSGTLVKATLSAKSNYHTIDEGIEVQITEINNNVFTVIELMDREV